MWRRASVCHRGGDARAGGRRPATSLLFPFLFQHFGSSCRFCAGCAKSRDEEAEWADTMAYRSRINLCISTTPTEKKCVLNPLPVSSLYSYFQGRIIFSLRKYMHRIHTHLGDLSINKCIHIFLESFTTSDSLPQHSICTLDCWSDLIHIDNDNIQLVEHLKPLN